MLDEIRFIRNTPLNRYSLLVKATPLFLMLLKARHIFCKYFFQLNGSVRQVYGFLLYFLLPSVILI